MNRAANVVLALVFVAAALWERAGASARAVKPLSKEWGSLTAITGFHSVVHSRSRVAVRVLEVDGSTTVAQNPVSLYVVASNQSSGEEAVDYVWRVPRGVARVRAVLVNDCGVDVEVDVDMIDEQGSVTGQSRRELRICMIGTDNKIESGLKVEETAAPAVQRHSK